MTTTELFTRCEFFLGHITGLRPRHGESKAARNYFDKGNKPYIDEIKSWELPAESKGDTDLRRLLTYAKKITAKGLPRNEQIWDTVTDIINHLHRHYQIAWMRSDS